MITAADVDYEGSIEIPTDLMEAAGLWEGEKVAPVLARKIVLDETNQVIRPGR